MNADIPEILSGPPPAEDSAETPVTSAANGVEEAADVGAKVVSSTVPSGYTISYCPEPRYYEIDGVRVPSVTTVLDVLRKDALTWWGMKIGVQGVISLFDEGALQHWYNGVGVPVLGIDGLDPELCELTSKEQALEKVIDLLKQHKLTTNHVRDKAATRGTSIHAGLESWAVTGQLPDEEDFPEEERGYIKALRTFLADCGGRLQPVHSELMVGSKMYGYAGRFDLMASSDGIELKTGPRTTRTIPPGIGILDLKTMKSIRPMYESHPLQLSGYRLAAEEAGYGRSAYEAIVQVAEDGRYDVKLSNKRPDHFLKVVETWRVLNG